MRDIENFQSKFSFTNCSGTYGTYEIQDNV